MQTTIQVVKQITKTDTSLVSVCHVASFTYVIHVYFIILDALNMTRLEAHRQFLKLQCILLQVILNFVIQVQLIQVILMIIYHPHLQLPMPHLIFKINYTCSVVLFTILLLTLIIKSIISVRKLKSLNSNSIVAPNKVSISNITGRKLSILECCGLLISDIKFLIVNCEFLITDRGLSILGLENVRMPQSQLFLSII